MAMTRPIAMPMGTEKESAPTPASRSTRRISSVAYATEERLSEAKTARPVTLSRRSWRACAVAMGRPTNSCLRRLIFTRGLPKALR